MTNYYKPSSGQSFLETLTTSVLDNLQNEQFGVKDLAELMCLSRSQLHRKLKKLTKKSTSQFIRDIRLEKAMTMIKSDDITLSEISYKVGFGSPSYFYKCFYKYFGVHASDVKNQAFEINQENKTTSQTKNSMYRKYGKSIFLFSVVILFIAILSGVYFFNNKSQRVKSIAVLPFQNDSPNNENVYFCNGIMEGILDHLSKIPDLRVISRTSVEQYRDNPPSVVEIAKILGVNYVLEGSVLRIGDRAKITAQLIYAPDDSQLWSKQFDKDLKDIFIVMSEVTKTIADDLKTTLSPELLERIEAVPTTSTKAYDYFLQGREYQYQYRQDRQLVDLINAEKRYKFAIETDSTFALAYADLANLIYARDQYNFYKNQRSLDSVLMLCNKSIALDKNSAIAYQIRGSFYDHIMIELDKAEADFKKALELNPNHLGTIRELAYFTAFHRRDYPSALKLIKSAEGIDQSARELISSYRARAVLYNKIGAWDEYLEYKKKAMEINPLVEVSSDWYPLSRSYFLSKGFFREHIEWIEKIGDPGEQRALYNLGESYLFLREYDKALEYFEKWEKSVDLEGELSSTAVTGWHRYGQTLVGVGREEEGIQMMKEQLAKNDTIRNFRDILFSYYNNAGICAFLGDKERAYKYLHQFDGSRHRWDNLIYIVQFDPLFDNIRKDPEFIKITKKVLEEHQRIRDEIARLESLGDI